MLTVLSTVDYKTSSVFHKVSLGIVLHATSFVTVQYMYFSTIDFHIYLDWKVRPFVWGSHIKVVVALALKLRGVFLVQKKKNT